MKKEEAKRTGKGSMAARISQQIKEHDDGDSKTEGCVHWVVRDVPEALKNAFVAHAKQKGLKTCVVLQEALREYLSKRFQGTVENQKEILIPRRSW